MNKPKKNNKLAHANLQATRDKKSHLSIPVFFHVPKNAGTYFIGVVMIFLRLFRRERTNWLKSDHEAIKNIEVYKDSVCIGRFICGDPFDLVSKTKIFISKCKTDVHFKCNLKDLKSEHIKKLFVFSIIIESEGFSHYQEMLDLMRYGKFRFNKCLILRDPFLRAQSMFNYLSQKKESGHEPTSGVIQPKNIKDYMKSTFIEDSWVIRNFLNLPNSETLTEEHFYLVDDILYDFTCVDIKNTDKLINLIFKRCFDYEIENIPQGWLDINTNQNKSSLKKNSKDFFDEGTTDRFSFRTRFDKQLWENHCL
ncbi:hypothetical protein OAA62_00335 [bacterium]|nr:hypothetical protein [bacterium]